MFTEEDIASAVSAGVLTEASAAAFRAHLSGQPNASSADEEHFRLVTGFNDIFVVIACVLLLASVAWIGSAQAAWLGGAAMAASAWGLAEFFTRKRRMALPSMLLLLAFAGGLFAAVFFPLPKTPQNVMLASALAVLGSGLHWLRFQVPITVAAGMAALLSCLVALLLSAWPAAGQWTSAISLVGGMAVFALALRWDASDPLRQKRHSDVAFWLHLLAAPLLVHPAFTALGLGLVGGAGGAAQWGQAAAALVLYLAIAIVSVAIDRRALMVSALGYVLFAFSSLLQQHGVVSLSFAFTALVIGSALLLLSAFWQRTRAWVLRLVPGGIQHWLAPLR